jgi:hypothetical protein
MCIQLGQQAENDSSLQMYEWLFLHHTDEYADLTQTHSVMLEIPRTAASHVFSKADSQHFTHPV